ncbi:zinc-dependent alcohol dehydrogenase family protein [Pseudonocardia sp. MH-G8]|uniref:zinc-dependent alcohol dehydrogenase family protein n=1 Tax=Pseudonocardia sp. MH-G8 TaxID=1854588 RepID=UPI000B9FC62E|nr:zinc-dependent alcohol dehydrogenase family protein [Pseudonocardia sp. MH-G8]OZM77464.1 2-deoxy-scyllo-inosamine dehydrogenase [Pseudonocardia sp. MH-G8]
MKAVRYEKPREFTVSDVPEPHAGPGEVRLRVTAAGVCGTDGHLHDGQFDPVYPLIPGHEIVGDVDEVGTGVTDLRAGRRVVVDNMRSCGVCSSCRRARPAFCRDLVAQGVNAPGGFAEYLVAPAGKCHPVDDLEPEVAVLTEPLACVIHGLDVLDLRPGSDVLVFGAGPTGLLLAQLLRYSGASRVTVAAPTAFKLEIAARHGADRTVEMDRERPDAALEQLRALSPEGFDVVVDATGAVGVLERCTALTRDGGTVFVYGMADESARMTVSPYEVFRRELVIKGSFSQAYSFDRALQALRSGRVIADGIITHRFGLDEYGDALAALQDRACVKAVMRP